MELVIHLELRSVTRERVIMDQVFELPNAEKDPMTGGERVIFDAFTMAQTRAYGRYLASLARRRRPPKQILEARWSKTPPPTVWTEKSGDLYCPRVKFSVLEKPSAP